MFTTFTNISSGGGGGGGVRYAEAPAQSSPDRMRALVLRAPDRFFVVDW
jgi:hypothetical protein